MLNILDIIFFVIILICALVATSKGFIKEVFGKASWVLALLLGVLFYKRLGNLFTAQIKGELLRNILAFVLIFVLVFLVVKIIENIISRIFSGEIVKGLDRALGFILGIVEGIVVVFVVIFLLNAQPWFDVSGIITDSFFFKVYSTFSGSIPHSIKDVI